VRVGGHPWVYAAPLPRYDFTPLLPQIFADLSAAGLDGIELMQAVLRPDTAVDQIGELAQRHRLPVIGSSFNGPMWDRVQHGAILDSAGLVVERLARLGGRTLGLSVGPLRGGVKDRKTPDQLDAQAELLRKIFVLCSRHQIVPNLHNHTYEVEYRQHDLRGTLERLPDARLGPDLNWLVRAGIDPVAFLREHGARVVFLHLRDQTKDGRWSEALGEGDTDFAAIGRVLREIGFEGHAIIELAHERGFVTTRPLRESFRLSRECVRSTLGF
ncbi:MAG: sugar phosphate isomerase/epimerase, partial [Opitutaceae bacterium]|nr:sugar phosphate isomerase/epimerase [Opitutaceae bacterium]